MAIYDLKEKLACELGHDLNEYIQRYDPIAYFNLSKQLDGKPLVNMTIRTY